MIHLVVIDFRRCTMFETIRPIFTVLFIVVCILLTVLVLMQEGKSAGLGSIGGAAETYWGKNKGRSMEGALVKFTRVLAILFMVLAAVLNIPKPM
jgi:preprotein translocase subunit SecG